MKKLLVLTSLAGLFACFSAGAQKPATKPVKKLTVNKGQVMSLVKTQCTDDRIICNDGNFMYQLCMDYTNMSTNKSQSDATRPEQANHLKGRIKVINFFADRLVDVTLHCYWKGNKKTVTISGLTANKPFIQELDWHSVPGHESENPTFYVECENFKTSYLGR